MSIELPSLRLGIAGFSADQQDLVAGVLERRLPGSIPWEVSFFAEADTWWINGPRATLLPDGILRVSPSMPSSRAIQLTLAEVDRPMAFAKPVASPQFDRAFSFDLESPAATQGVLDKFTAWMQPLVAQFGLASCLVDHYCALGPGVFDVTLAGRLIAVIDMRGRIGLLPTASPAEFAEAMWRRRPSAVPLPEHFLATNVSQLMWQYALRTKRDLLPKHYRAGPLYFRRPPRVPQRMMKDAHLLLLRELASAPGSFDELGQRTGLAGEHLARPLAALYYVGAITSNPRRAAPASRRRLDATADSVQNSSSILPSLLDSKPPPRMGARRVDLTAPMPMVPPTR